MQDPSPTDVEQPILPAKTWAEFLSQITVDSKCSKPGCYGRGWTSVSHDPKTGLQTLNTCKCAKYVDNGYVILSRRLDKIMAAQEEIINHVIVNQAALYDFQKKKFDVLVNLSYSVRIVRWFNRLVSRKPKNVLKNDKVPVVGEVNSATGPGSEQTPRSALDPKAVEALTKG